MLLLLIISTLIIAEFRFNEVGRFNFFALLTSLIRIHLNFFVLHLANSADFKMLPTTIRYHLVDQSLYRMGSLEVNKIINERYLKMI